MGTSVNCFGHLKYKFPKKNWVNFFPEKKTITGGVWKILSPFFLAPFPNTQLHWLHLFDFSPLCLFNCALKTVVF